MSQFSTSAILLRRTDYGDYDLILSVFSLERGKLSLIAKSAKKSSRRFPGVLELFSEMDLVGSTGRGRGLAVLQEAALKQPFARIRSAPLRVAYASYWAELVNDWMEEGVEQPALYGLLRHVLGELDRGEVPEAVLSVVFQMRFLRLSGHDPNLACCVLCRREVDCIPPGRLGVDVVKGGIACPTCLPGFPEAGQLSKGTAKQLLWVSNGDLGRAARMKFGAEAAAEALRFLERFVPHHLGREPRSLKVLRQLRGDKW
jgi:DNA repair protein RecO (recombination protein O)